MLSKKIMTIALTSSMILSMGASTLVMSSTPAEAATVVSENAYEKIMAFSSQDLSAATGVELTTVNIQKMYDSLKNETTWTALDYTAAQASMIAQRVSLSMSQTKGILKSMIKDARVQLKVVSIEKPNYVGINLGSIKVTQPEIVEPEVPVNPETPEVPGQSLDATIKAIDIEIDYKQKKQDIDLEFEVKNNNQFKASYENEATNQKLKNEAAKAVVDQVMSGLDYNNLTQEQIANEVTSKLGSNSDYKKFSFKVKFIDGSRIEFKIK